MIMDNPTLNDITDEEGLALLKDFCDNLYRRVCDETDRGDYANAPLCRHCKELPATQARGLCGRCYRKVNVRNLYPQKVTKKLLSERRAGVRSVCVHCKRLRSIQARGLCGFCHKDVDIRECYEKIGNAHERGFASVTGPKAKRYEYEPTNAQPGSEEKIVVLEYRREKKLPLWHPADKVCGMLANDTVDEEIGVSIKCLLSNGGVSELHDSVKRSRIR